MEVILICASSLDGKIARGRKDPVDWTSKEDKKFFANETKKAGVILMGKNTFEAIRKALPRRLNIVFTSRAKKLKSEPGVLEFTDKKPELIVKNLAKRGFKRSILIGGSQLNSYFFQKDLIDEIWLTIESVILGRGISLFKDVKFSKEVVLTSVAKLGEKSVLLKYRVK